MRVYININRKLLYMMSQVKTFDLGYIYPMPWYFTPLLTPMSLPCGTFARTSIIYWRDPSTNTKLKIPIDCSFTLATAQHSFDKGDNAPPPLSTSGNITESELSSVEGQPVYQNKQGDVQVLFTL